MYKVIQNGKHLAEWKKKLPLQAEVLEKSEVIKRRLLQSVCCFDEAYGSERNLENDLGGFIIILYGTSKEISEHYRKIMHYYHLNESEYEYEDRYKEPERSEIVTFRLYLCSSDYGIEIVTIEKQAMNLENRVKEGNLWEKNKECLCLEDIKKSPPFFEGTEQQWIEEVTSFQYSNPKEWQELYAEYLRKAREAGNLHKTALGFYRSDDGYLRKENEKDIYLKIRGVDFLTFEELCQIGERMSLHSEQVFQSYLEYCVMDEQKRNSWKNQVKEKISSWVTNKKITVDFAETLDESTFTGKELYFDILNRLYIIL